jgi:hypothetical protein
MRRREFITLVGGSAAAWPLAVRAQQAEHMRRIGVLMAALSANDPEGQARVAAFLQGLQELGWSVWAKPIARLAFMRRRFSMARSRRIFQYCSQPKSS